MESIQGITPAFIVDAHVDGNSVVIDTTKQHIVLYHEQDCCEIVSLRDWDIAAEELQDLADEYLVSIDRKVVYGRNNVEGIEGSTFYTIRTQRVDIDLSWDGSSNGYYSITVSCRIEPVA